MTVTGQVAWQGGSPECCPMHKLFKTYRTAYNLKDVQFFNWGAKFAPK